MPSHSVHPSPLQSLTAVGTAYGAQHVTVGPPGISVQSAEEPHAPAVAGAAPAASGCAVGDERGEGYDDDMPTQVPEEDADSEAEQPGDAADEPQQAEAARAGDAEDGELPGPLAVAPSREPASRSASPAATCRGAEGRQAADGEAHATKQSPFAAAKAALRQRQIEAAAAAAAPRVAAPDPYDFPETQEAGGQPPAAGAELLPAAPAVTVSAVPESDDAPTSREKTPPMVAAVAAGSAAVEPPEGSAQPQEDADSPDQQSQHVPKATARRGAPTATDGGNAQASNGSACNIVDVLFVMPSSTHGFQLK